MHRILLTILLLGGCATGHWEYQHNGLGNGTSLGQAQATCQYQVNSGTPLYCRGLLNCLDIQLRADNLMTQCLAQYGWNKYFVKDQK